MDFSSLTPLKKQLWSYGSNIAKAWSDIANYKAPSSVGMPPSKSISEIVDDTSSATISGAKKLKSDFLMEWKTQEEKDAMIEGAKKDRIKTDLFFKNQAKEKALHQNDYNENDDWSTTWAKDMTRFYRGRDPNDTTTSGLYQTLVPHEEEIKNLDLLTQDVWKNIHKVGQNIGETTDSWGNAVMGVPDIAKAQKEGKYMTQDDLNKKIENLITEMPDATDEEIAEAMKWLKDEGYIFEGINDKHDYEKDAWYDPTTARQLIGWGLKAGWQAVGWVTKGYWSLMQGSSKLWAGDISGAGIKALKGTGEAGMGVVTGAMPIASTIMNTDIVQQTPIGTGFQKLGQGANWLAGKGAEAMGEDLNTERWRDLQEGISTGLQAVAIPLWIKGAKMAGARVLPWIQAGINQAGKYAGKVGEKISPIWEAISNKVGAVWEKVSMPTMEWVKAKVQWAGNEFATNMLGGEWKLDIKTRRAMENLWETWPEFVLNRDLLWKDAETTANNVWKYKIDQIKAKMDAVKDFGEIETPKVAKDVANSLRDDIIKSAEKLYWKWNLQENLEYYNSPLARVLKLTDDVINSDKIDYMKLEQLKELHDYLNPEGIQYDIKGNAVSESSNLMSAGKRSKLQSLLEERWAEKWVDIKQINRDIQWAYAMEQGLIKADSRMGNLNMMWLWDTQTAVVSAILWWAPGAVLWVIAKKWLWSEGVKSYVAKKIYSKPKTNDQSTPLPTSPNTTINKSRVDRIMDNSIDTNTAKLKESPISEAMPESQVPWARKTIIETPLNPKWNITSALAGKKGVLVWDSKPTLQLPARTPSGIKIRQADLQNMKSDIAEATRTRRMGDDGTDIVFQKVSELIDSWKITEKEWIQIMKEIVAEKGTPDGQKYFWVDKNYLEGIIKDLTGEKETPMPKKNIDDPFEELRKEEPKKTAMPQEKPKTQEQEAQEWQMNEIKKEKVDSVYWPELDKAYASLKWSEGRTGLSKTQDRYSQIEENSSQNKQFKAFSDAVSEYNHRTGKDYSVQEMKDIMDKQSTKSPVKKSKNP